MKVNDQQKEDLAELRDSPAWQTFVDDFVAKMLTEAAADVFMANRPGGVPANGMYAMGRRDGMIDLLAAVYAGQPMPAHLRELGRTV